MQVKNGNGGGRLRGVPHDVLDQVHPPIPRGNRKDCQVSGVPTRPGNSLGSPVGRTPTASCHLKGRAKMTARLHRVHLVRDLSTLKTGWA